MGTIQCTAVGSLCPSKPVNHTQAGGKVCRGCVAKTIYPLSPSHRESDFRLTASRLNPRRNGYSICHVIAAGWSALSAAQQRLFSSHLKRPGAGDAPGRAGAIPGARVSRGRQGGLPFLHSMLDGRNVLPSFDIASNLSPTTIATCAQTSPFGIKGGLDNSILSLIPLSALLSIFPAAQRLGQRGCLRQRGVPSAQRQGCLLRRGNNFR